MEEIFLESRSFSELVVFLSYSPILKKGGEKSHVSALEPNRPEIINQFCHLAAWCLWAKTAFSVSL